MIFDKDIVELINKQLNSEDYDMCDILDLLTEAASEITALRAQLAEKK